MIEQNPSTQRRSSARRPFAAKAFAVSSTRDADVLVTDISYGGCQLQLTNNLDAGEDVNLIIPRRGAIAAEIRWVSSGRAGARFAA